MRGNTLTARKGSGRRPSKAEVGKFAKRPQKEIPDEISEALKKMTSLIMNYKTMAPYNSGEDIKTEKVRKDVGDLKRVYLSYLGHLESEADML